MCGLVYYNNFEDKNVAQAVIKRFQEQRSRGLSGFGFFLPEINKLTHNTAENRILKLLGKTVASEIMFHHRIPTSTENIRNACHPFSTKDTFKHNYVMIHNGVIINDDTLADEHKKRGIKYVSAQKDGRFNDSEALMYDIALYLEGEQASLKAEGNIAFIMVENDENHKPLKLHFGRNSGSPLQMNFTDNELVLASQATPQDDAISILPNRHYIFDYETKKISSTFLNIPDRHSYRDYNTKGYEDFHGRGGDGWFYGHKQPVGFRTDSAAPFEPVYELDREETYWDLKEKRYIPASEIQYGSDSYFGMMADRGETLAFDVLTETGNLDEALEQLRDRAASVKGKVLRLNQDILQWREGSKKANKIYKERLSLWVESDMLEEAIATTESVVREEVASILSGETEEKLTFVDGENLGGLASFLGQRATSTLEGE